MNVSNNSSNEVYYSDDDIELQSISEDESDIELSTFITNPIKDTDKSLKNNNVKELTKDLILNSLQENHKKLEQDHHFRYGKQWHCRRVCGGTAAALILTAAALTCIIAFSNPVGWIIGGISLVVFAIASLLYVRHENSITLSSDEEANIRQENEKLYILLSLLKNNEDFKKQLDSGCYKTPFTLDQLMDHAKPFLPPVGKTKQ